MTMRWILASVVSCCVLVAAGAVGAQEADNSALSASVDATYVSKYVWRGIVQTESGAFQPSVTVSHKSGLAANFWASHDLDAGEIREHDYTLSYTWSTGPAEMGVGYIYYAFPNTTAPSTSEIYLSAAFDGKFSPALTLNYDIDEADGFYLALSSGYDIPLGRPDSGLTCLNLSGRVGFGSSGYNDYWFFGANKSAVTDVFVSAALPLQAGKTWTITPSLNYTAVLDGGLRNALTSNGLKKNCFYVGVSASAAF